ncbi:MAG: hypothetical protein P4M11_03585 [Candidatus Pacebacteria bacterium]|nr:hypothetical protein [Candidatus Paceibacterota bacterium]
MFKSSLFILWHFEEKLLTLSYEPLVQFLNELPKTDFFSNPEIEKKYRQHINDFNVTEALLDRLNDEHSYICVMSQEYKKEAKPSRQPFKHYISAGGKLTAIYFPN